MMTVLSANVTNVTALHGDRERASKIDDVLDRVIADCPHVAPIVKHIKDDDDRAAGFSLRKRERQAEYRNELETVNDLISHRESHYRRQGGDADADSDLQRLYKREAKLRAHISKTQSDSIPPCYPFEKIEKWALRIYRSGPTIRFKPRIISLPKNPFDAFGKLNATREGLQSERDRTEAAPLTYDEAKAALGREIDQMAAAGTPRVRGLFTVERDVPFQISRQDRTRPYQGKVKWPSHHIPGDGVKLDYREPSALNFVLFVFKGQILKALDPLLRQYESKDAISWDARFAKIAEIDAKFRDLDFEEGALANYLIAEGKHTVTLRSPLPVEAVLQIEAVTASPSTPDAEDDDWLN